MDTAAFHNIRPWCSRTQFDLDVFGAAWRTTAIDHGLGVTSRQGFHGTCAAHAVCNAVEAMGLGRPEPKVVYRIAQRLDGLPDTTPGTDLRAAAEAACRVLDNGTKWTPLPLGADWQYVPKWLASRGPVALAMAWSGLDDRPTWSRVMFGQGGTSAHAVCVYGFRPRHVWRRFPVIGRRRVDDFLLIENSGWTGATWAYMPPGRVGAVGIAAVGFVKE